MGSELWLSIFEEVLGGDLEPVEFLLRKVVSVKVVLELPELLAERVRGELGDQEGGDYCQANDDLFTIRTFVSNQKLSPGVHSFAMQRFPPIFDVPLCYVI